MGEFHFKSQCRRFAVLLALLSMPAVQGSGVAVLPGEADTGRQLIQAEAPYKMVAEGAEATIRLRRDDPRGSLQVSVQVDGSATPGRDYTLEGLTGFSDGSGTFMLADGQAVAVVVVDALDDSVAEEAESIILTLVEGPGYTAVPGDDRAMLMIPPSDTVVTTIDDHGEGSLRQAILNANRLEGADIIRFDTGTGPFLEPQTIVLTSDLPQLTGKLTIDGRIEDRLWQATGVTLSGGGKRRVLHVAEGAVVTLRSLTIADGHAAMGGGILNEGTLVVEGMTFLANAAGAEGGGLANSGGTTTVINSTFAQNQAGVRGGGMANLSGEAVVTNCTFSENESTEGGGLFSSGTLRLSNSILANSLSVSDCLSVGDWDAASTHNLIVATQGCGMPVSCANPRLMPLGGYNGPTSTFPLGAGSPAINHGDNAAAVDHTGQPLVWDQRGNGDPRFVAGITDIGAFENQRNAWLVVDTAEDTGARACTRSETADCSLRGALTLANAAGKIAHIRFDTGVFGDGTVIQLRTPLPPAAAETTVDGRDAAGVIIETSEGLPVFTCQPGAVLKTIGIEGPGGNSLPGCEGLDD